MAKKNKYIIGTVLTAVSLAVLIGMFFSGLLRESASVNTAKFILIPILAIIFIFWGYKKPKSLELTTYAVAILLLFQAGWDWYVHDWNNIRSEIAIPSIISIIINSVSGKVRVSGAKKTFKGQLGLK